jgi:RsiW-degrading membrane proteinase PrsW (M82 family)
MLDFLFSGHYLKYFQAGIFAAMPILLWSYIIYRLRPEKLKMVFLAFLVGCFSPVLMLIYQKFWGKTINLIFFDLEPISFVDSLSQFSTNSFLQSFLVFVFGVGMMEEFIKHLMIKKEKPPGLVIFLILALVIGTVFVILKTFLGDVSSGTYQLLISAWLTFYIFSLFHRHLELTSIDQVILISIMSALGFAFIENIHYMISIYERTGDIRKVANVLALRSLLVVMIHVMCSAVFGYYYGISLFATSYLQKHHLAKKPSLLNRLLHKILGFKDSELFKQEKMLEGLILSMLLHGIYDFIIDINISVGEFLTFFKIPSNSDMDLYLPMVALYFVGGFLMIRKMLKEKNNHLKFGLVGSKALPEGDFNRLLGEVDKIQHHQQLEERVINSKEATREEIAEVSQKIAYIKKMGLLEDKYLQSNWISKDKMLQYRQQIQALKKHYA